MNSLELDHLLRRYPVTVCAADQIRIENGPFIIANTDNSDGKGKHWVTFYFNAYGFDDYFDSLGKPPEYYGFRHFRQRRYWMNCDQIQDSNSIVCGLYCIYYVMNRCAGKTMKDIVEPFDINNRTKNDAFVVDFVNKNKL